MGVALVQATESSLEPLESPWPCGHLDLILYFCCLTVLGLSCGMWDLVP